MASDGDMMTLVTSASRGDDVALSSLLGQLVPDLRGFLRRRMGAELAARESSSDLVQSVCREVLQRLADERLEHRSAAEFKQWLYNAAIFKLRNRLKYWGAARRDPGQEAPPADDSNTAFHSLRTPSQEASLQEQYSRLEAAIERLPPEQRRVVVLAKLEGRSHREIAAELGISEGHSRVLLARGLARLASLCDDDAGG
jgi:RNA polymerase sigma-70 factor (ECF subfamily)